MNLLQKSLSVAIGISLFVVLGCGGSGSTSSSAPGTAAAPSISPSMGIYTPDQTVTITTTTSGAAIHYTTDGTAPSLTSLIYTAPFALSKTSIISAIATANGLNNSSTTASSFTAVCPIIIDPSYYYPGSSSSDWYRSVNYALPASATRTMVANPASGSGTVVDTNYVTAIRTAQAKGIKVYGYIDTNYGAVPTSVVTTQAQFYKANYGVDGVFFDRSSGTSALLSAYTAYVGSVIGVMPGKDILLNTGSFPDVEDYMKIPITPPGTLIVNTSEKLYSSTGNSVPSWVTNYPAARFAHILYGVASGDILNAVKQAVHENAGEIYVQDIPTDTFNSLPSDAYWSILVNYINGGCK